MRKKPHRGPTLKAVASPAVFLSVLVAVIVGLLPAYAQAELSRDFFGVVLSIEDNVLLVSVEDDVIEVTVDSETLIRLPLKSDADIGDLAEGDRIAVSLRADGAAVADQIFLIPTKTRFRHVFGTVATVTDTQITVQSTSADADPFTFDLTDSTKINLRGVTSKLEAGVRVVIVVERDDETGEIATEAIGVTVVRPTAAVGTTRAADVRVTTTPASIRGVFQRIDFLGRWVVSGTVVVMSIDSKIAQGIVVGDEIEIEGYLSSDDTVAASEIRRVVQQQVARRARFEGVFDGEDPEGRWIISGHALAVDDRSDTDGQPQIGESVIVSVVELDDGTVVIREIENIGFTPRSLEEKRVTIQGTLKAQVDEGLWRINVFLVRLNRYTTITGRVAIGSPVRVTALRRSTGGLLAISIEGLSRSEPKVEKKVTIEGTVTRIDEDGTIVVGHRTIGTSELTEIEGDLIEGSWIKVSAVITNDQTLVARRVDVRAVAAVPERHQVEIEGIVESLNGTIVVNGVVVVRNDDTQIEGNAAIGAQVTVIGWIDADGSLVAGIVRGENRGVTRSGTEIHLAGKIELVERNDDNQVTAMRVDSTTVVIVELTQINVSLRAGVEVDVRGVIVDGRIVARTIQPRAVPDSAIARPASTRSLTGVIEAMDTVPGGSISVMTVNGIKISLNDSTRVDGQLAVGANVTVQGVMRNDTFVALSVKVNAESNAPVVGRPFELAGRVGALSRNRVNNLTKIVIAGRTITAIPGRTKIDGTLVVGAVVKVEGRILDGTSVAVIILVTEPAPVVTSTVRSINAMQGRVQEVVTNANGRVTQITVNGLQAAVGAQLEVPNLLKRGDTVEIHVGTTDTGAVAILIRLIAPAEVPEEPEESATTTPVETRPTTIAISGVVRRVERDASGSLVAVTIGAVRGVITSETKVSGRIVPGARVKGSAALVDGVPTFIAIEGPRIVGTVQDAARADSSAGAPR